LLNQTLVCQGCHKDFYQSLDREDPKSIEYYTQGDGQGTLVNCKICNESGPRNHMHYLDDSSASLWFCDYEHMYAYKAASDVLFNPNCNLWIRVQHYTQSS